LPAPVTIATLPSNRIVIADISVFVNGELSHTRCGVERLAGRPNRHLLDS
jgi:hypothetical protein